MHGRAMLAPTVQTMRFSVGAAIGRPHPRRTSRQRVILSEADNTVRAEPNIPQTGHPERQNATVRRFGISYGILMAMEQHRLPCVNGSRVPSLPCAKGGGTRQRDEGIVEMQKTIPHPLRGSPLYTKGPAVDHSSPSAALLWFPHHTAQKVFCLCSATTATQATSLFPPPAAVGCLPPSMLAASPLSEFDSSFHSSLRMTRRGAFLPPSAREGDRLRWKEFLPALHHFNLRSSILPRFVVQ